MFRSRYCHRGLSAINRVLDRTRNIDHNLASFIRCKSGNTVVTIGQVSKQVKPGLNPEYVPRKYLIGESSQEELRHLKWMLQKDLLGQDIFLVGGPGPRRRTLALAYLELTGREAEFISLSRDTTEADLKQRREIERGTANYKDQGAVRAAVNGRVLILEGVEKAERNVLPVLNNLLENREMHLEDGRFLVPASRYDKLLQNHTKEELDSWRLVRVSEDFRVVALGLPSSRYPGHPLDPPLRSRFQARHIPQTSFKDQLESLKAIAPDVDSAILSQLLSCCHALVTDDAVNLGLPDFPLDNLSAVAKILNSFPVLEPYDAFYSLYPYKLFLGKEGRDAVEDILKTFGLLDSSTAKKRSTNLRILNSEITSHNSAQVRLENNHSSELTFEVPAGSAKNLVDTRSEFVETNYQSNLLARMMRSHLATDFCLIGPKGCGKSTTVKRLAQILGYQIEPIVLYQGSHPATDYTA